jgi:hypothetical protein
MPKYNPRLRPVLMVSMMASKEKSCSRRKFSLCIVNAEKAEGDGVATVEGYKYALYN